MEWIYEIVLNKIIGGGPIAWGVSLGYIGLVAYGSLDKIKPLIADLKALFVVKGADGKTKPGELVTAPVAAIVSLFRHTLDGHYSEEEQAEGRGIILSLVDRLLAVLQKLYSILVPAQIMTTVAKWGMNRFGQKA